MADSIKAANTFEKCRTVAILVIARTAFSIHLTRAFLFRRLNAFIRYTYTSCPHKRIFIEFHYFPQTKIRLLLSFTYKNTERKGQDTCRIAAKSISVSY